MFWKQTIAKMKKTELQHYTQCQNRMNKISDYIQGPLAETIQKVAKIAATDAVITWKKENIFEKDPIYNNNKKNKKNDKKI